MSSRIDRRRRDRMEWNQNRIVADFVILTEICCRLLKNQYNNNIYTSSHRSRYRRSEAFIIHFKNPSTRCDPAGHDAGTMPVVVYDYSNLSEVYFAGELMTLTVRRRVSMCLHTQTHTSGLTGESRAGCSSPARVFQLWIRTDIPNERDQRSRLLPAQFTGRSTDAPSVWKGRDNNNKTMNRLQLYLCPSLCSQGQRLQLSGIKWGNRTI